MKKSNRPIVIIALLLLALGLCGCEDMMKDELAALQDQIDALTVRVDQMNESISSMGEIVREIQSGGYVKDYVEIVENGKAIGWKLTFSNGKELMLYNGKDGKDGATPQIGVRKDTDGEWYWTLNDEWLLRDGQKIRVNGKDGQDGKIGADGVTPQLKIESDWWWVSYDKGNTWTKLSKAKGEDGKDGDSYFSSVARDGDSLVLTLGDGSSLVIPCYQPIQIEFSVEEDNRTISAAETIPIPYTLSGAVSDTTVVSASSDGNYVVAVTKKTKNTGIVYVTCPRVYTDGFVNVIVTEGYHSYVRVINFTKRELVFSNGLEYRVDNVATTLEIPFQCNFEYTLSFRNDASSWITHMETKAVRSGTIVLSVSQNTTMSTRTGYIDIKPTNHPDFTYATITVIQASAEFSIDKTRVNVPSEGGSYDISMTASRGVKLDVPASLDWVTPTLTASGGTFYSLHLDVARNTTGATREGEITVYTESGNIKQSAIEIVQLSANVDHNNDMVLTVSANIANDETIYLPVHGKCNVYIDWGDGSSDIIDREVRWDEWISHTYHSASLPTYYEVSLTGTVQSLCMSGVPSKNGIREIKQWGDLGVTNYEKAFYSCNTLQSVAGDDLGAFSDITSFQEMFADCTQLKDVSGSLFAYARKGTYFGGVFAGCSALTNIPEEIFSQCLSATSFYGAFSRCSSLTTIPENLFANNLEVVDFSYVFREVTSLQTIPEQLFSHNSKVVSFNEAFNGCSLLGSLPEMLFFNSPLVTSFERTFAGCGSLKEIPGKLFSKCTIVNNFSGCFAGSGLVSIPEELFFNCPEVKSFNSVFRDCHELKTIPVGLFDGNRKVEDFSWVFYYLRSLASGIESPYTVINGRPYHLYERYLAPDYFVTPTRFDQCFAFTTVQDDNNIPSSWK